MASMQERYDTALLGIMHNEGNISDFLDVTFSFLYRRTDFFQHLNEKKTMGFPPGVASKIAYKAFKKYEDMADEMRKKQEERRLKLEALKNLEPQDTPPVAREEVVEEAAAPEPSPVEEPAEEVIPMEEEKVTTNGESSNVEEAKPVEPEAEGVENGSEEKVKKDDKKETVDPDDDPEVIRQQKIFQANPESYNGAIRENYSWGQEIRDVDVQVKLPAHVTSAKQLNVTIQKKRLSVRVAPPAGSDKKDWITVVDGELSWEIIVDQSMWSLDTGKDKRKKVSINLEKVQERWWDCLIVGESKISVRKIDPSRPMTDLDDESQAKVEEMMWNQRRKEMGLPQSHEIKMEGMMKSAWDAEGSPFKGQPFDMSKINISGSQ